MFFGNFVFKGLCGAAICGVTFTGYYYKDRVGSFMKRTIFPEGPEALIEKVGLSCGTPTALGVVCEKRAGVDSIGVKKGEQGEKFDVTQISGGGKIKVYKLTASDGETTGYNKDFKFVIEDGDIGDTSNKLEEFETYEIKEETEGGGSYLLSRKSEAKDGIKKALGLPTDCDLPTETEPTTCDNLDKEKIKGLAFDSKDSSDPTLTGTVKLTITKLTNGDTVFPFGYKFGFQGINSDASLTWSGNNKTINFKNGVDTDYRILKREGNQLTLQEAWTLETLTDKVGLNCATGNPSETNGVVCNKKTGSEKVKVKKEEGTTFELSDITNGGKIKVYKDGGSGGYNQGFKFVIEEADIGSSDKLEEFETYEIKKEETGDKWYLTRKEKAVDVKKKLLGLPDDANCKLPESGNNSVECQLDEAKLKKINFEDKGSGEVTVDSTADLKLKITITSSGEKTEFPHGYKFVLESNKDISFPNTSKSIKKNTNTEFKIKKGTDNKTLTLEKAWTVATLGQKVGLNCQTEGDKTCTLNDGNINVNNGTDDKKYSSLSKKTGEEKKVKYEENAGDHNQGIKFYVEGNDDICLQTNGGQDGNENKKIEKVDTATYEVKKDGEVWYLYKKPKAPAA